MIFLITGGASGLGRAITEKLAQNATDEVYFTYNRSFTAAEQLTGTFKNTRAIKCNFEIEAEVNALVEQIEALDIDVLVNNAYFGTFINTYFHKIPIADFLTEFRNNIVPAIAVTQAAIKKFRIKKAGKIITILTAALVEDPPVGASVYLANKSYLEALTKSWSVENAKFNITSNAISPSLMLTNFTKDIDGRLVDKIREEHPSGKLLTTEEVAETVFSLANDITKRTGNNIIMNGRSSSSI